MAHTIPIGRSRDYWKQAEPKHQVGWREVQEPMLDIRIHDVPGNDGCLIRVRGILNGTEYYREYQVSKQLLHSKDLEGRERMMERLTSKLKMEVLTDMNEGVPYNRTVSYDNQGRPINPEPNPLRDNDDEEMNPYRYSANFPYRYSAKRAEIAEGRWISPDFDWLDDRVKEITSAGAL